MNVRDKALTTCFFKLYLKLFKCDLVCVLSIDVNQVPLFAYGTSAYGLWGQMGPPIAFSINWQTYQQKKP